MCEQRSRTRAPCSSLEPAGGCDGEADGLFPLWLDRLTKQPPLQGYSWPPAQSVHQ